jgi:peptidoglycan/LPS O-acetylase OafA/YrhL
MRSCIKALISPMVRSAEIAHSATAYRPDIDGLRAVAVSAVVLFHMGLSPISGGFIGVDIFFVISGFLITSILTREMAAGSFSFRTFLLRRVRRLAPALLVVLLVTLAAGFFVLAPAHYRLLGQSTVAAVLSASNILFWTEAGYFDEAALYKPILHTWSLGVEEQFYLVWPLLTLFLLRLGPRYALLVLGGISLISLTAAELLIRQAPDAVFFLMPFRIYEFGFGAALAFIPLPNWRNAILRDALSILGLVLILVSFFIFDEMTQFPGISALVPCLGASLFIAAGVNGTANRLLTITPIVRLGRVSYSLYLVHWPVVVYFAYLYGPPDQLFQTALLTLLCVVLGVLMYRFVETPFRIYSAGNKEFVVGQRRVLGLAFTAGTLTIVLSGAVIADRGMVWRMPVDLIALSERNSIEKAERLVGIRAQTCQFRAEIAAYYAETFESCLPADRSNMVVILGDSHAADIWYSLSELYPYRNFVQLTGDGCSFGREDQMDFECINFLQFAEAWIAENALNVELVIYSQRAAHMMTGDPLGVGPALELNMRADVRVLERLETIANDGPQVVFWGPRAEYHPNLEIVLANSNSLDDVQRQYDKNDLSAFERLDAELEARFEESNVVYLSSYQALCQEHCPVFRPDGGPLFTDYAHWSPAGGQFATTSILATAPEFLAWVSGHGTADP